MACKLWLNVYWCYDRDWHPVMIIVWKHGHGGNGVEKRVNRECCILYQRHSDVLRKVIDVYVKMSVVTAELHNSVVEVQIMHRY